MSTTTIIPDLKNVARQQARNVLSQSLSFQNMDVAEQKSIYMNLVDEYLDKLNKQYGLSSSMANKGPGAEMGFGGYDPGFQESVDAFEDLVDSVDFPKFVADLMKAVFDANITVMKKQTDDYIRLMREATKGVAQFVKQVGDDESFAYLAETKNDMFNIAMEPDENGNNKMVLTDPKGEKVDTEDSAVKAKIMEAKIAMAKEHRAALRECILMGVTRLVVDKGEIEAGVDFNITAKRHSDKSNSNTNINKVDTKMSYSGPLGGIFGGPKGSMSISNTNINVSTSKKSADDTLSAALRGKVKIQFKTDYFKLDNFAQMYADGGVAALKPAQPGAPVPAPVK